MAVYRLRGACSLLTCRFQQIGRSGHCVVRVLETCDLSLLPCPWLSLVVMACCHARAWTSLCSGVLPSLMTRRSPAGFSMALLTTVSVRVASCFVRHTVRCLSISMWRKRGRGSISRPDECRPNGSCWTDPFVHTHTASLLRLDELRSRSSG